MLSLSNLQLLTTANPELEDACPHLQSAARLPPAAMHARDTVKRARATSMKSSSAVPPGSPAATPPAPAIGPARHHNASSVQHVFLKFQMRSPPLIPLVVTSILLGFLGICLLASKLQPALNPQDLTAAGKGVGKDRIFIASRAALRATHRPYNLRAVIDRLLAPSSSGKYRFQAEQFKKSRNQMVEEDDDDSSSEPDVWSEDDLGDETTRTELEDILMVNLPALIIFVVIFCVVEIAAMLARRGRDWMLQTSLWKQNESTFLAQVARESQIATFRPYLTWLSSICIFATLTASIDVFGKCYWNWACFFDLDCNLRILAPAVVECSSDVFFPAGILTGLLVCLLLAAIWCFTRPWAAGVLAAIMALGVVAVVGSSPMAVLLWVIGAWAAVWFYFWVLPFASEEVPFWCQDLGSLAASSDPVTRELRDGDAAQRWRYVDPVLAAPTLEELSHLSFAERVAWNIADFMSRHGRAFRIFWNGVLVRGLVLFCCGRRLHISGREHVAHLSSHDTVLLAANHRTFFDFFVVSAAAIWNVSGAPLFSIYPVRCTFFYSNPLGGIINLLGSASAMFPPILNTPSDAQNADRVRSGGRMWNDYAVRRMAAELRVPGTMIGIHPEGTRNRDPNPCAMTQVKSGVGRLALESPQAHVIPVFVVGFGENLWEEIKLNFAANAAEKHPIHVVFGPHVDLSHLRATAASASGTESDGGASPFAAAAPLDPAAPLGSRVGGGKAAWNSAGRAIASAILALATAHADKERQQAAAAGDPPRAYQEAV